METYALLKELTKNTLDNAKTNMHLANGKHLKPKFINEADKYILFEKTIREDRTEYYSNAWSFGENEYFAAVAKLKGYQRWYNYIDKRTNDPKTKRLK